MRTCDALYLAGCAAIGVGIGTGWWVVSIIGIVLALMGMYQEDHPGG